MGSSCVWHVMILLSLFLALPSCLLCAEFAKVGMTSGLRAINPLVDQFSLNIYVLQCSPAEVMSGMTFWLIQIFITTHFPRQLNFDLFSPVYLIFLTYIYSATSVYCHIYLSPNKCCLLVSQQVC